MPYMFNEDKTKAQFAKVFEPAFDSRYLEKRVKLWQGDGTDRNGVTLNFDSLPGNINLSDYRYLMLVGVQYSITQGEYVTEGTAIIPTNHKFNGSIFGDYGYHIDNPVQTTVKHSMRPVNYGYTNNTVEVGGGFYMIGETNSGGGSVDCGVDDDELIPYELWGFI